MLVAISLIIAQSNVDIGLPAQMYLVTLIMLRFSFSSLPSFRSLYPRELIPEAGERCLQFILAMYTIYPYIQT